MLDALRLYFRLIRVSIRSQMQYRASFFILAATHFISTFVDIIGIWVLFDRFKMVQGWTLGELALIYGIIHMGFAAAEASARGFDTFSQLVKNGDFDRILLRPCGTLFQVAVRDFQMMRIGRFLQGFVVLMWSCSVLHISLGSFQGIVIFLSLIGTASLFYALVCHSGNAFLLDDGDAGIDEYYHIWRFGIGAIPDEHLSCWDSDFFLRW